METHWMSVIAKAAAYSCLMASDSKNGSMLERCRFLQRFGLPLSDIATLLGSSAESLRELERQAKLKNKKKK